jgi:hypothetical protein
MRAIEASALLNNPQERVHGIPKSVAHTDVAHADAVQTMRLLVTASALAGIMDQLVTLKGVVSSMTIA